MGLDELMARRAELAARLEEAAAEERRREAARAAESSHAHDPELEPERRAPEPPSPPPVEVPAEAPPASRRERTYSDTAKAFRRWVIAVMICCAIFGLIRQYYMSLEKNCIFFFAETRLLLVDFDTAVPAFEITLAFFCLLAVVSTIVFSTLIKKKGWAAFDFIFLLVVAAMMALAPAICYLALIAFLVIFLIVRWIGDRK